MKTLVGRKRISDFEKTKSKASRAYWKYQETLTPAFEEKYRLKEVQFAESDKRMGRPPVKLSVLQSKAINAWHEALAEFRAQEAKEGLKQISEEDVINFKKKDKAGRKGKDEVLHLKKYIRRTERTLELTKLKDESEFNVEHKNAGRPGMTKPEKVQYYEDIITKANAEINVMMKDKEEYEIVYYDLFDVKNDRRQLRIALKEVVEGTEQYQAIQDDINAVQLKIDDLELAYKFAKQKAGVTHVRQAPVDRATSFKSEFEKLKAKVDNLESEVKK